jgi:DNA invertase Pin-like site-specific DNA recombinase
MKVGYARVSKQEQHEALQIDALKEGVTLLNVIPAAKEHAFQTNRVEDNVSRFFSQDISSPQALLGIMERATSCSLTCQRRCPSA